MSYQTSHTTSKLSKKTAQVGDIIRWHYIYDPKEIYISIITNVLSDYSFEYMIEVLTYKNIEVLPYSIIVHEII